MAPSLLAVLYRSQATEQMDRAATLEMLVAAREHNERAGISGLLILRGTQFMQLLEGPHDAVDALLARIVRDPRHTALVVTHRETVTARRFPDWAMAFEGADTLDSALHPGVRIFTDPLPSHGADDEILVTLAAFLRGPGAP